MIQTLELFGGIGAPRCAFRNIGVPVKAIDYVEIDEKAVRSYNAMFEHDYHTQTVVGWNLRPDILIHGSPCQDFSIAGKQKGADEGTETRSSLMWETIKIIKSFGEWKPKVVIWENVKNVRSKYMVHNHNLYIHELKKIGYTSSYALLNAYDFGLPQKRERIFTVSILGKKYFNFSDLKYKQPNLLKNYLSKYEEWHIVTQPSILEGIGNTGIKRTTVLDKYAYTITCRQDRTPAQVIKINSGYRYLTELECWRLMGFSDSDYYAAESVCKHKKGMNRTLYKQAGNAIAVPILEELFKTILNGNYL